MELTDQQIKEFEKFFNYMYKQDTLPTDTVPFALVIKSEPVNLLQLGY